MEGNHYFPATAVNPGFLVDSDKHTVCPWKGTASYKTLIVDGQTNPDAGWFYPKPRVFAARIKGRFAFWRGVEIVD